MTGDLYTAFTPFPDAVPPPPVDPAGGDLVYVCFNAAWLPYVLGALNSLVDPTTWAGSEDDKRLAVTRADDLLRLFVERCQVTEDGNYCCDDTNNLLADMLAELGHHTALLNRLVDCCQSLAPAAIMQADQLRDDFGGENPEDPASVDGEVPDTTYSHDSTDTPDDTPKRLEALCATIDDVTAWAWAKAADEYRLLFNIIEFILPIVKEIPGAVLELAEEFLTEISSEMFADEDAMQTIRCCMYEAMKDQDTHDILSFNASLADCNYVWLSHENMLKQIVVSFLSDPRNWHAFHRQYIVNYKRSKHDELMSTSRCICRQDCWDFDDGDAQGWLSTQARPFQHQFDEPENMQIFDDLPDAIEGWSIGNYGNEADFGAFVRRREATPVTHVVARFWASGTSISRPWVIKFWAEDKTFITQLTGNLSGGQGWYDVSQPVPGAPEARYVSVYTSSAFRTALDLMKINDFGLEPCGPG